MSNSIVSSNTVTPIFSSGSSTLNLAGSSSLIFTGNVGIGTIAPSQKMTIYSNGSVGLSNSNPGIPLDVHDTEPLRIKLFDLITDASLKYKISGEFAMNLYDLFQSCGGNTEQVLKNFETLRDLLREKVPRSAEPEFYDIIENRIRKMWGLGSGSEVVLFESIDD